MPVSSQRLGHAVVVTIDRPERRNALDGPTIEAIGTAFVAAEADDDVRAVVLTGSGDRAFFAGCKRSRRVILEDDFADLAVTRGAHRVTNRGSL